MVPDYLSAWEKFTDYDQLNNFLNEHQTEIFEGTDLFLTTLNTVYMGTSDTF